MNHRGLGVMGCNHNGNHGACSFILNMSLVVGLLQMTESLQMTIENESILATHKKRHKNQEALGRRVRRLRLSQWA